MLVPRPLRGENTMNPASQPSPGLRSRVVARAVTQATLRNRAIDFLATFPLTYYWGTAVNEGERDTESRIAIEGAGRPRLSLLVMGERGVFTHALPDHGVLRVGRAEHCEISVGDTQLSREHAQLVAGPVLQIVDLGSFNGTRIDGRPLVPHEAAPLASGNVVTMGNTVLLVQHAGAEARTRQLWSHGYFESRLEEECARAEQRETTFAILRVRFDTSPPGTIESRLSASVSPDHVVASYAPGQYE